MTTPITESSSSLLRIDADVERLLPRLEALGPLTAVTGNPLFDHRKTGVYRNVYVHPHVSSVAAGEIDLRIFPGRWVHGFAAEEGGELDQGFRFFDSHGAPVHTILLAEESDRDAYEALVQDLHHPDQDHGMEVEPAEPPPPPRPDDEVDVAALESDWRAIEDTHDFLGMLREHRVSRTQALRLVSDELARPAAPDAVRRILNGASEGQLEIMVFVRNPGTIQIHHGPVDRIVDGPPGLSVLDPGFELRVREGEIAASWVVRKSVEAGWVTSIEAYDSEDTLSALFFGCRERGRPEDPAWRELATVVAE